jgi:APA family basic amino acid/polyamine antiporter
MADVRQEAKHDGEPTLDRSVGPLQMTLYGLGSMLGAGLYGLIGKAAGEVGNAVWLAFIVALVAALLTALSYASLGSRYPRAAGAVYVAQRAYGLPLLSFMIGLALVCSGLTSIATQSRVFGANFLELFGLETLPVAAIAICYLFGTTMIIFRGIQEAMWVNVLCTVVSIAGLLLVVAVGLPYWGSVDYLETPPVADGDLTFLIVIQGAVLAFFAFIGFEDMYNVAEEVREPQKTIPIGLISAMLIAAIIYIAVAITAVMERAAPIVPPILFTAITIFAVANTGLVNFVTASRLLYGMARQNLLPDHLGKVHRQRRTPHIAILVLFLILVPLALMGTIAELAAATVLLLLTVFAVVNGALFILQGRKDEPAGRFEIPRIIPALGFLVCMGLIVVRVLAGDWRAPAIAGGLLLACFLIYLLMRQLDPDAIREIGEDTDTSEAPTKAP